MKKDKITDLVLSVMALILVGLMNTVFIRPEDIGSIKNYIGYALIFFSILITVRIIYRVIGRTNE